MSRKAFQTMWGAIAARWTLSVEMPFEVTLASGVITVPVRLQHFGAPNGMLLVTNYATIAPYADELVRLGFGYSCLAEPREPYSPEVNDEAVRDMLEDWGWSGSGEPPEWLRHQRS